MGNLISEVSRIREMMGLVVEQTEIRNVVQADGTKKRFEVFTEDGSLSVDFDAEFNPGKYLAKDMSNSVDGEISQLADYLSNPDLKGKKLVIVIKAGSSRTPITPGGTVANELQKLGLEPTNASLAQLRANTALELVKNGLTGQIPQDVFNNIEFTTDLSGIEQGPEFISGEDDANDPKYKGYQKLGAEAFASGFIETLAELPDICNTKESGSGKQGLKKNKGAESGGGYGYAAYPENEGKGMQIDLGLETEGEVTLNFTAYHIPDMFQVTYNGVTHTSSGPGGEGFVSNDFKTCEEGSGCYKSYMSKINRLKKKINKDSEGVTKAEGKTGRLTKVDRNMLLYTHGIETPVRIGREWITAFFEKFKPESKNLIQKAFSDKKAMKYNKNFTNGYTKYDEDGNPKTNKKGKIIAKVVKGKDVWDNINDIWIKLDDNVDSEKKSSSKNLSKYEKEIKSLQSDLNELMASGNPGTYSEKMSKRLRKMGFPGVIGTNGSLTFEKIVGQQYMFLQVFAPLDGTVWGMRATCKDLGGPTASR